MAVSTSGLRMQKAKPAVAWPVTTHSTPATRKPDAFVHSILSCIVGTCDEGKKKKVGARKDEEVSEA